MFRQKIAAFATLLEHELEVRSLDDAPKGESLGFVQPPGVLEVNSKMLSHYTALREALARSSTPPNGAGIAAAIGVDCLELVDALCAGALGKLPPKLHALNTAKPYGKEKDVLWFRWEVYSTETDRAVYVGKCFAVNMDAAMVDVRTAAIADKVPRPLEIAIARVYRVLDATVQKTSDVTGAL